MTSQAPLRTSAMIASFADPGQRTTPAPFGHALVAAARADERIVGMTADLGSLQRLPKLMPLGIVKELAYTGRRMTAQEAASHGLVNAVYDTPEATVTAALACAREIAAGHFL